MSVINKMLKDLEQRHDDSAPDEISAVYQPPTKKPVSYIIIALSVLVIGLGLTISWLLLKNNTTSQLQLVKSEPSEIEKRSADQEPQLVNIKSLKPAVKKQITEQNSAQVSAKSNTPQASLQREGNNKSEQPNTPIKVVTKPDPMVPVVVKPAMVASKSKPVSKAKVSESQETSTLTIVKSSEQYSPEQRLEQLMKKAQTSFDRGYVSEAVEKLNKVLSISDGHVEARNLLAVAWYGRGELQQAVTILNDGLSKYPMVELWRMTAAKIYFKENNIKGAFSYLDIELTNASLEFYSMKASMARKLELYASAETAYLMLTQLQPDVGNWWLGHAISLDSQGKFDDAIMSYQAVVEKGGILGSTMTFVKDRIQELKPQ